MPSICQAPGHATGCTKADPALKELSAWKKPDKSINNHNARQTQLLWSDREILEEIIQGKLHRYNDIWAGLEAHTEIQCVALV